MEAFLSDISFSLIPRDQQRKDVSERNLNLVSKHFPWYDKVREKSIRCLNLFTGSCLYNLMTS